MKDVSEKIDTLRSAVAQAIIKVKAHTMDLIKDNKVPKGNVLEMARASGILAAKKTSELIPLCHQIPLDIVDVEFELQEDHIKVQSVAKAIWKTGVEMEALTAVTIASLTIYDMLKPLDDSMEVGEIKLINKRGGKSDWKQNFNTPLRTSILVLSDSVSAGKKEDRSGKIIQEKLKDQPLDILKYEILPDEFELIKERLIELCDNEGMDLVLTTGGTGLSPRDITVEATNEVIEREIPGISEASRSYGFKRTPYAMLSRGVSGVRGKTIIINLPGSSRGAAESIDALFPWVLHSFWILRSNQHETSTVNDKST